MAFILFHKVRAYILYRGEVSTAGARVLPLDWVQGQGQGLVTLCAFGPPDLVLIVIVLDSILLILIKPCLHWLLRVLFILRNLDNLRSLLPRFEFSNKTNNFKLIKMQCDTV